MSDIVARLAAESDIRRIIHLYSHAIDRRRWELMDQVFHPDARYKFGKIDGDWRDFLRDARAIVDPLGATHHHVGNTLITLEGNVAHVETYLNAYHVVPADYPQGLLYAQRGERYISIVGGRYIDRFEDRGSGWRIAMRTGLFDWIQDLPFTDGGLSATPVEARGCWTDADPSFPVTAALRGR